ncbi:MAG: ABC transporter ATP-binding protein [Bradyrhizobium sp.]|uniref:ABC transporter ATP-binding protein n=1 Tax=Bradyrhizobium sp. TaxID=376 RepID=UPI0025C523BC|nr:ABC transporter ATP-binding protein [Bradyrhizobium sp.]MBI5265301.1 ABC transporter ATP-binding protein [Bradyrhizobium sp.]
MARLEVRNLTKAFGGVLAVEDVSFTVETGIVYSVIGPNGAGKTTLFNLITGLLAPSVGEVRLDDQVVTGLAPHQLAAKGMARTFQNLQICMNMTAVENVMVGGHLSVDRNLFRSMLHFPSLRRADVVLRDRATELMAYVGLDAYLQSEASAMPYGALKRLEIARALAAKPRILFLDEPAAGLNPRETAEIDRLIRKIADGGVTVVLVEHDMKMVMNISDRILVLNSGKKLTEGSASEVRGNPDVIAAYLGKAA